MTNSQSGQTDWKWTITMAMVARASLARAL